MWKTTQTLRKHTRERKPNWQILVLSQLSKSDISRMDFKKHQSRMNFYTGSNDVLYWLYNSQQICKEKTGIYLWIFGIFTFWWSLASLWQHFGRWFLCYPSLIGLYYKGWYWDKGVRKETLYLPKFWSLATLNFEIWINQTQNSSAQIQKVEDWIFN